jgi:hypothetical protein
MPPLAAIRGLRDMGLFDGIMGKKGKNDDMVLEPRDGGYVLKNHRASAPDINKVCVFFSSAPPLEEEPELLKSLIKEFHVGDRLAHDALITTAYEAIPGIDEYLATREMPESLNAFIMTRAMLSGLAHGPAEMGRLAVNPFDVKGARGVLVLKEA